MTNSTRDNESRLQLRILRFRPLGLASLSAVSSRAARLTHQINRLPFVDRRSPVLLYSVSGLVSPKLLRKLHLCSSPWTRARLSLAQRPYSYARKTY